MGTNEDASKRFSIIEENNEEEQSFKDNLFQKKYLVLMVLGLIVVGLTAGAVYAFLNSNSNPLEPIEISGKFDDPELIDDFGKNKGLINPINGERLEKEVYLDMQKRKPIAVMVNNFVEARPSNGLSDADIVYEIVAESGITRLMPIFYSTIPENVGSVRSARYYFAEFASGYKPHYIHWGAAHVPPCQKEPSSSPKYCPPINGLVETVPEVDAYDRIVKLGLPNLDGGNYECMDQTCAFSRDPEKLGRLPREHTAFVRLNLMYDLAKEIRPDPSWHKYIPIQEWLFKEDATKEERGDIGATTPITYEYWEDWPEFVVKWEYNKENNEYIRYQGGKKQIDNNNQEELKAKVVVVRLTEETSANDRKHHLKYKTVGTGPLFIFQDGNVIEGSWQRTTHEERDIYVDPEGNQIKLNRGKIWVQVVPQGNTIEYKKTEINKPSNTTTDASSQTGNTEEVGNTTN